MTTKTIFYTSCPLPGKNKNANLQIKKTVINKF